MREVAQLAIIGPEDVGAEAAAVDRDDEVEGGAVPGFGQRGVGLEKGRRVLV